MDRRVRVRERVSWTGWLPCWLASLLAIHWASSELKPAYAGSLDGTASQGQAGFTTHGTTAETVLVELLRPRGAFEPPGTFVPLISALRKSSSWREGASAYWNLVEAYGLVHIAADEQTSMAGVAGPETGSTAAMLWAAAAARLEADRRTAELSLHRLQQSFAALLGETGGVPLLPEDRPHVGGYQTRFTENFPGGGPPRAARLHETLAGAREALELGSQAVLREEEELQTVEERLSRDLATHADFLTALARRSRARRAFLSAATRYNQAIGDYVWELYGSRVSAEELLPMLVALPRARGGFQEGPSGHPAGTAQLDSGRAGRVIRARPAWEAASSAPLETNDLLTLEKPHRAQRLAFRLHAGRQVPTGSGACRLTLEDYLRCSSPGEWRQAVRSYWRLATLAMRLGVQGFRLSLLREALASPGDDANAERAILEEGIVSAESAYADTLAQMKIAQAEVGRYVPAVEPAAIDPVTAPHGGRYWTRLAELPPAVAQREDVVAEAEMILKYQAILEERAAAAVYYREHLDMLRGAGAPARIADTVRAVNEFAAAADAMLEALASYNVAIADYSLAVLPPGTPVDALARSLVLERPANGE